MQAVARAADGRGPATAITNAALSYFKVENPDDLSTAIYSPTMTNDRLAGFAREIVRVARVDDRLAIDILQNAGRELGAAALTVIKKLRMEKDEFPVACVGGVYGAGGSNVEHYVAGLKMGQSYDDVKLDGVIGASSCKLQETASSQVGVLPQTSSRPLCFLSTRIRRKVPAGGELSRGVTPLSSRRITHSC